MTTRDLDPIKKKKIYDCLRDMQIVLDKFTGKIIININDGAICDIERIEKLR